MSPTLPTTVIIGAGFSGLSAACHLAKAGVAVTVLEKHDQPGGRARAFSAGGFTWDMGPSWYWMPDVFERFFAHFGKRPSDYYKLVRLDPSYRVMWPGGECTDVPASMDALTDLFEKTEAGAGRALEHFLAEAGEKYRTAMKTLVYLPGLSPLELARPEVIKAGLRMNLLRDVRSHVARYFRHPRLRQLAEFPILFLGALPQNTPALYTLMNYADMALGTWYPMGGMAMIARGMRALAESLGVRFHFSEAVEKLECSGNRVSAVVTGAGRYTPDVVIAAADYHFVETQLLPEAYRNYSPRYWAGRKMAPSSLLFYVGVNKRIDGLLHHNLFFDADFEQHAQELYAAPAWPTDPLMYVCCPGKTDPGVAPPGCENLFILIPTAPGMEGEETDALMEHYFRVAMERIEARTGDAVADHVVYKRAYGGRDFAEDYHAFRGNAYGLANVLRQTAFLKPSMRNKKAVNLFYTGQLTVPGPGVPPAIISGEIAATQALRLLSRRLPAKHFSAP